MLLSSSEWIPLNTYQIPSALLTYMCTLIHYGFSLSLTKLNDCIVSCIQLFSHPLSFRNLYL